MKRIISLALACLLLFSFSACGKEEKERKPVEQPSSLNSESAPSSNNVNANNSGSSSKMTDQELSDFMSDKYFTADPADYPTDIYGEQIGGEFGSDIKALNDNVENGSMVSAFYKEGDDTFQVHYSPSSLAVETNDYETIAVEFIAMAQLIASNMNSYTDLPAKSCSVVLGRSSAVIVILNHDGSVVTSVSATTGNEDLDKTIKGVYKTVSFFKDTDIDQLLK